MRRVALAATVVVLAGCAQSGPPRGGESGGPGGPPDRSGGHGERMGGPGMPPAAGRNWMLEQAALQLGSARERIAITADQAPAWDRFAASIGALIADLTRTAPNTSSMPAPQLIGLRVDAARNRYAALESVSDTMNALYAVLSSEQRALADRALVAVVPSLYDGPAPAPATTDATMPRREGGAPARGPGRGRPPGPQ